MSTLRRFWPDILDEVKIQRRYTWMLLIDRVQVASLDGNILILAFADEGKRKNFLSSGSTDVLSDAIAKVLKANYRLDAVLDPDRAGGKGAPPAGPSHSTSPPPSAPAAPEPTPPPAPTAPPAEPQAAPPAAQPASTGAGVAAARAAAQQSAASPTPRNAPVAAEVGPDDDEAHPDDETMDDSGLSGRDLLMRELGATVLEEIQHD